jgi:four helix bundle protein
MKVKEFKTETKALAWVVEVRKAVASAPCDDAIRDQIRRAAASVLLNLAEGAGHSTAPSQARHYAIARASVSEALAGLRLLRAEHALAPEHLHDLHAGGDEISRMLWGLIRRCREQPLRTRSEAFALR